MRLGARYGLSRTEVEDLLRNAEKISTSSRTNDQLLEELKFQIGDLLKAKKQVEALELELKKKQGHLASHWYEGALGKRKRR